ncbi:hypothetical protein [Roseomonas indoligenes]|nr:hypothetical protein [Pararoseomonas indoligenes]
MKEMFALLLFIVAMTVVFEPEKAGQWYRSVQDGFAPSCSEPRP